MKFVHGGMPIVIYLLVIGIIEKSGQLGLAGFPVAAIHVTPIQFDVPQEKHLFV